VNGEVVNDDDDEEEAPMAQAAYELTSIAELEGTDGWSPIRQRLGVGAFGINAWTAHAAGEALIPAHDELPSGHEELYLVVSGAASFTVAGDEVSAPAGSIVFVRDPAARREAVAREPETTVVAVGGAVDRAFRPRSWETNKEVVALLDSGEYEAAKRLLVAALDRYEDPANVLYNLACAEALLGETEQALEHLGAAVRGRPSLAAAARDDADLSSLRDDPRFARLI
jgi:tetratricopeptide (TPR) repeat protein